MKSWAWLQSHSWWAYGTYEEHIEIDSGKPMAHVPLVKRMVDGYYIALNQGRSPWRGPIENQETARELALLLELEPEE